MIRPSSNTSSAAHKLRLLAVTTIKERTHHGYTRGLALTFLAYRRKRLHSVISEVASSF
jgi:hypothetical protein